jgi:pimeloyl-ACP methyl ester carboxylesterase
VFADDAADVVRSLDAGPAVVIGHSMGGLHALALAAGHPELARGVVVEDMGVDQRGRTVDVWREHFDSWPTPFESLDQVREFFAPYGDYFAECFERGPDGYRLAADLDALYEIAAEWGERDYWPIVARVGCPAGMAVAARVPGGGQHVRIAGTGHVVHADAPDDYRRAVTDFLVSLP